MIYHIAPLNITIFDFLDFLLPTFNKQSKIHLTKVSHKSHFSARKDFKSRHQAKLRRAAASCHSAPHKEAEGVGGGLLMQLCTAVHPPHAHQSSLAVWLQQNLLMPGESRPPWLTCAFLPVGQMRGDGDGALLSHAHADQTLVHAGDDVAPAHVGVVRAVARVAASERGRHKTTRLENRNGKTNKQRHETHAGDSDT